jgi:hypothetical protein
MRWVVCALSLFVSLAPALAQAPHLSFGAIGGVRLTDGMSLRDESRPYTVGPAIEARFGNQMAVEFNALYKRLGSASFVNDPLPMLSYGLIGGILLPTERLYYSAKSRVHSWEFPVLGKYYVNGSSMVSRFFLLTGYTFQRGWVTSSYIWTRQNIQTGETTDQVLEARFVSSTAVGAVFGGGFTRKVGPLIFAPTFRYTRWGVRSDGANRNQAEFLLALSL